MPYATDPTTGLSVWSGTPVRASSRPSLRTEVSAHEERLDELEDDASANAAEWGNLTGDVEDQADLMVYLETKHPSDYIDDAIDGLTAGNSTKLVYSTQDHATPTYVRSTTCWGAGFNLTCVSPWNSGNAHLWAGTAITPRHIVMAHHAYVADGSTIRFITSSGGVVTRTVSTSMRVGSTDIRVGILDSDLPDSITPAKLLPDDWSRWLTGPGTAVAFFDQEEKLMVGDIATMTAASVTIEEPGDAQRQTFWETPVDGDSGNPILLFYKGETVLLACFQSSNGGPSLVGDNLSGLLSAITTLGANGHAPEYLTFLPSLDAAAIRNPSGFSLPGSVITSGTVDPDRLGSGVVGSGELVLHDDGVFRAVSGAGLGNVSASSNFAADNRLVRSDGITKTVQDSVWACADHGNITATMTNGVAISASATNGSGGYFNGGGSGQYGVTGEVFGTNGFGAVGYGGASGCIGVLGVSADAAAYPLAIQDTTGFYVRVDMVVTADRTWRYPDDTASPNIYASRGWVATRGLPQNSQSADYTLVIGDANQHIYHPSADTTPRTWTIPANASVAFAIGTEVVFVNDSSAGAITIAITSDTLVLAGSGSTGSRTLAANGVARAIKITSTRWMISGTGLT